MLIHVSATQERNFFLTFVYHYHYTIYMAAMFSLRLKYIVIAV